MTMPPFPTSGGNSAAYYQAGSTELAKETPVTLKKLEPRRKLTGDSSRLVIALVGLPARGKSFVARKLQYYLNWSGVECKIFNVGRYRREAHSMEVDGGEGGGGPSDASASSAKGACAADFFDAKNTQAAQLREKVASIALEDMLRWLDNEHDNNNASGEDSSEGETEVHSISPDSVVGGSLGIGGHQHASNGNFSLSGLTAVGANSPRLRVKRNDRIAIFDATNSTAKRRQWILEQCTSPAKRPGKPTGVVFLESICNDEELIAENLRFKATNSPDYDGMDLEAALADLRMRVAKYEEQYETITNDSMSYIKMYNLSTKLLVNHIYGRMAKELVPALMAWHIGTRPVFLVRPGQTISGIVTDGEDYVVKRNKKELLEGDPRFLDLSRSTRRRGLRGERLGVTGQHFREELLEYLYDEVQAFMQRRASVHDMAHTGTSLSGLAPQEHLEPREECLNLYDQDDDHHVHTEPFPMHILTSTMPRAVDTVDWKDYEFGIHDMSNLNPLDKGDFAGMELDEIHREHPEWFERLEHDPFGTRFPGGECYRDLIRRLTSVVIDIEQQVIPTLVVSHLSILQCLMAYFRNTPVDQCTSIEVPMHTVIKFTPVRGGGWSESQHYLFQGKEVEEAVVEQRPVFSTTTPVVDASDPETHPLQSQQKGAIRAVESVSEFSALTHDDFGGHNTHGFNGSQNNLPIWGDSVAAMSIANKPERFYVATAK